MGHDGQDVQRFHRGVRVGSCCGSSDSEDNDLTSGGGSPRAQEESSGSEASETPYS
jgi:hypothetical protein